MVVDVAVVADVVVACTKRLVVADVVCRIGSLYGGRCWKRSRKRLLEEDPDLIAGKYPYVSIGIISVRCLWSENVVIETYGGLIGSLLLLLLDDLEDDVLLLLYL